MLHVRLATLLLVLLVAFGACAKPQPPSIADLVKGGIDNLGKVEDLLKKGQDVNAKNAQGFTALMVAAEQGQTPVVKTLLDKGSNSNFGFVRGSGLSIDA